MPLSLIINDAQDAVMQAIKQYSVEFKDLWIKRLEEIVVLTLQRFMVPECIVQRVEEVEEDVMDILQNDMQYCEDLEIDKFEKLGKEAAIDLAMVLVYFPGEILGKKSLYGINLWVLHRKKPAEDVVVWVFGRSLQAYYLQKLRTRYKM